MEIQQPTNALQCSRCVSLTPFSQHVSAVIVVIFRVKFLGQNIVNKIHHKYWSALVGCLYVLDLTKERQMEHTEMCKLVGRWWAQQKGGEVSCRHAISIKTCNRKLKKKIHYYRWNKMYFRFVALAETPYWQILWKGYVVKHSYVN